MSPYGLVSVFALLKQTKAADGLFPSEHIPTKTIKAEARDASLLAEAELEALETVG